MQPTTDLIEAELCDRIIGCCIQVHRVLGPGFTEKIYEEAVAIELTKRGLKFERQKPITIYYDDKPVGDHRLDFLVESRVVLELKACKDIDDVHLAISKSYLKATKVSVALITNFAQPKLQIRRVVLTI